MTDEEYLNLITSEHRGKVKFEATVLANVSPLSYLQTVMAEFPADFDIDQAIGVQLDAVGIWIGRSRRVDIPLTGVYFSWDDVASTGWESGSWQGQFDPDSGLVDLPDDAYRVLLKAKIAANRWDGTIPGAYAVVDSAFGDGTYILIQDNQDMSMSIGISGISLSAINQAVLLGGYLPLKPEGVRIQYYMLAPSGGKLLAWDVVENDALAGWGSGEWGLEVSPPLPPVVNPVLVNGFLVTVDGEGVFS